MGIACYLGKAGRGLAWARGLCRRTWGWGHELLALYLQPPRGSVLRPAWPGSEQGHTLSVARGSAKFCLEVLKPSLSSSQRWKLIMSRVRCPKLHGMGHPVPLPCDWIPPYSPFPQKGFLRGRAHTACRGWEWTSRSQSGRDDLGGIEGGQGNQFCGSYSTVSWAQGLQLRSWDPLPGTRRRVAANASFGAV